MTGSMICRRWSQTVMAVSALKLVFAGLATGGEPAASGSVTFPLEALSRVPRTFPAPGFEAEGVESLFYEGVKYHDQPTRIFAYRGVPTEASAARPVPAMVLIHGGGGTAFDRWVRLWNSRGYAAIAMDLCGCVPVKEDKHWKRHEHAGPPGWGASFQQLDEARTDQWTWHAVSAVALAHSLLSSDPRVDARRTGVTGISWGGYLTSIVAGVDSRFKCAIPVYGCGFLSENSTWLPQFEQLGPEKASLWVKQWDPSMYLPKAAMPLLWVNGTNDFAYPMDSWQKSYRQPSGPRTLCLRIRMPHGHGAAGENPEEIRVFADHYLKGRPGLGRLSDQTVVHETVTASYECPVPVDSAELCYTVDTGKWQDRLWQTAPASINPQARKILAVIPPEATVCFLNLTDERGCVVSSEHIEISGHRDQATSSRSKVE